MKKTILCIDDIKTNLFIIQSVLEDMADDLYDVILASSANEGLSILLKQKVDIILMDIMMPEIDGLEATKMIKSNKKTKDIPVIFVTAKNDDETIGKCYKVGGDDYVNKPFNHVELLSRISFHLASREKDLQILEEKEYAQNILDLQENLIVVTSGEEDSSANRAFLDFFKLRNINLFREKYTCVCETFVRDSDFFSLNKVPDDSNWVEKVMELSESEDILIKMIKDDEDFIFNLNAAKFKEQYILTFTDITQMSQQAQEYKHEANVDSLTQIYNRNMFHRLITKKLIFAKKERTSFVFIILDIDHFKSVNDTHGHLVGDNILVNMAKLVQNHIRDNDIFARWGGEEFVLAFDVDIKTGVEIANNLRRYIEEFDFDVVGKITCSFGLTELKQMDTLDVMIQRADEALYEAKSSGRNKVCKKI